MVEKRTQCVAKMQLWIKRVERMVRGHESSFEEESTPLTKGCLAFHVTIPLNRNFQSWRWGFLLLPPSTVHTKTLCFYFRRPVSYFRKLLHDQFQNERDLPCQHAPAPSVECASLGVTCLVDKLRFIQCEVAACLPFTFTCQLYKELSRSNLDLF
ncbi:hypothetical protein E4T50_07844 [Aureobasidium sp. EXF-12298]|nr:hypothetical protein E4T50_07844 [Aureobasidium sp. EXF-12298]